LRVQAALQFAVDVALDLFNLAAELMQALPQGFGLGVEAGGLAGELIAQGVELAPQPLACDGGGGIKAIAAVVAGAGRLGGLADDILEGTHGGVIAQKGRALAQRAGRKHFGDCGHTPAAR
jgi:hypothetical protein